MWQPDGPAAAAVAVAVVEAVEDNLSAKAAGNESVNGCMTACDDEIGRRTTTQQPTNERRRGGGGGGGGGSGGDGNGNGNGGNSGKNDSDSGDCGGGES